MNPNTKPCSNCKYGVFAPDPFEIMCSIGKAKFNIEEKCFYYQPNKNIEESEKITEKEALLRAKRIAEQEFENGIEPVLKGIKDILLNTFIRGIETGINAARFIAETTETKTR
jgi:hypothetical protein